MVEGEGCGIGGSILFLPDPFVTCAAAKSISIPPCPQGRMIRMPLARFSLRVPGDKGRPTPIWGNGRRHHEAYAFLRRISEGNKLKSLLRD